MLFVSLVRVFEVASTATGQIADVGRACRNQQDMLASLGTNRDTHGQSLAKCEPMALNFWPGEAKIVPTCPNRATSEPGPDRLGGAPMAIGTSFW